MRRMRTATAFVLESRGLALVVVLLAGAVLTPFNRSDLPASLSSDEGTYLLQARMIAEPDEAPTVAAEAQRALPGAFPWLLAVLGAADDWRAAHLVAHGCWLLGLLLMALLLVDLDGRRRTAAPFAMLLVITAPGVLLLSRYVLAEGLFMALSAAVLLAARRMADSAGWRIALLTGLLTGLAVSTRSLGFALLPAVLAAALVRRRDLLGARQLALCATGCVAVLTFFSGVETPPEYRATWSLVGEWMQAGPGALGRYLAVNLSGLLRGWHELFLLQHEPLLLAGTWWLTILATVALLATLVRAFRGEPVAIYVVVYLLVVVLWPYPGEYWRFFTAVLPLALWSFFDLFADRRYRLGIGLTCVFFTWVSALPVDLRIAQRFLTATGPERAIAEFYRHGSPRYAQHVASGFVGVLEDLRRIGATTGEGDRVYWLKPDYGTLFTRRVFDLTPDYRRYDQQAFRARLCAGAEFLYASRVVRRDRPDDRATVAAVGNFAQVIWERRAADGSLISGLYDLRAGCAQD